MNKPLIVAVEPDPQQAAELASMFQRLFTVELVLANSTTGALSKLADRVPELVLTSALIPPKDEAALIAWLRELGTAGAHVQTVTIPMLATDEPQSRRRGGGVFGRERSAAGPDSCDPAVFADWISVYFDLASTHRAEAKAVSRNGRR